MLKQRKFFATQMNYRCMSNSDMQYKCATQPELIVALQLFNKKK